MGNLRVGLPANLPGDVRAVIFFEFEPVEL